ncbi:pantoate kinase [Candidatus Methanoliparum sp. LAM-1]|uniref:pantoate kinase n=1 Tax=Candidatus Methanoliparum sp. LAM-1 TaxID=2874846 RepID=UPI001E364BEF|nr:pantoate kinase [Candidatus Methanoliparum sp. LAM-1]BDC35631.1 pantothenate kinase [Candidatus Methanoliparum sp. LAM-1]
MTEFSESYSPSHITGFFSADNNLNPKKKGAMGAGIILKDGCITKAEKNNSEEIKIYINGVEDEAKTSRYVALKILKNEGVKISSNFDVPIKGGFGASAAGAISTALALNKLYSKNLTFNKLSEIAHIAEVENKTGLGDVDAISVGGGLVMRKKGGSVNYGSFDIIPVEEKKVGYILIKEICTKDILEDGKIMGMINKVGKEKLKSLLKRPTLENFMKLSCEFSSEIGLVDGKIKDAIEDVITNGGLASMAMIGGTVFAINKYDCLRDHGVLHETEIMFGRSHIIR